MSNQSGATPIEVHRRAEDRVVGVIWSDGHLSEYPFDYLRGWCPCAGCQGHGGDKRYVEAANTDLDQISQVGNYALQMHWGDGHDTGIYTYDHLRQLCPCADCRR